MRSGGSSRPIPPRCLGALVVCLSALWPACRSRDPEHRPDAFLRAELGLTDDDRVHVITLTGGNSEHANPDSVSVPVGAYVQFVTDDWRIHEVIFDLESVGPSARGFLRRTEQLASPPLVDRDSRFLVSFDGAPPGRYPYRLEGNARPGRGVVVVVGEPSR